MKKRIVFSLVVLLSVSLSANALELPQKPAGGFKNAVGSTVKANADDGNKVIMQNQIKDMITKSDAITEKFKASLSDVLGALLTKEEKEKLKARQEAISKNSKSKEKNADINAILADTATLLAEKAQSEETANELQKLDATQKAQLINSINGIGDATLGYLELADSTATLLLQITSDPVTAMSMGSDLKELKKVAKNLPTQAKTAGQISASLFKIATKAGLKVKEPTSKGTKVKKETNF